VHWKSHLRGKAKTIAEGKRQKRILTEKQLTYRQYEFMTEVLEEEIRRLIKEMCRRTEELGESQGSGDDEGDLMTGLENTLRVMAANATEKIKSFDKPRGLVDAQHWDERERFCLELVNLVGS
jgi:hypothetical protein